MDRDVRWSACLRVRRRRQRRGVRSEPTLPSAACTSRGSPELASTGSSKLKRMTRCLPHRHQQDFHSIRTARAGCMRQRAALAWPNTPRPGKPFRFSHTTPHQVSIFSSTATHQHSRSLYMMIIFNQSTIMTRLGWRRGELNA